MTKSVIEMVKEFHETFGHSVGAEMPTQLRQYERIGYVSEELNELLLAIVSSNNVGILDALGDIMYFVNGTFVEFGLSVSPVMDFKQIDEILPGEDLGTDLMLAYMNLHAMTGQVIASTIADADKKTLAHLAVMHNFIIRVFRRLGVKYYPVLAEIHRSNMSKLWPSHVSLHEDLLKRSGLTKEEVNFSKHENGDWIVTRLDNNKVVKNPDMSQPELEQFL